MLQHEANHVYIMDSPDHGGSSGTDDPAVYPGSGCVEEHNMKIHLMDGLI